MPTSTLPRSPSRPRARAAAAGRHRHDVLGAQRGVRDGLALGVRLEVLAGAVGAQRRAHRREQVAAPPHRGVHRQRHRDVVAAQHPGGRVALTGALLALGGHRHRAAGGRDPVVGVRGQRRGVHVDRLGVHEPVLVHQADAVVVGRAPDTGVGGHRQAQVAGHLEGRLLREGRVAGDVEGELESLHVAAAALEEVAEPRRRGPGRRRVLDVAVGEQEAAGDRDQRVHGGVGVLGALQAVGPVHAGGHARVDRLDGREQVAGVHVLRAEAPAPVEVVPDEVLGQRPVGAVAAHRRLPHVPVGVDHARHDDPAAGVDLVRAGRHLEADADRGDATVDDEHVVPLEHGVGVVDGDDRAPAQDDGLAHGDAPRDRTVAGRLRTVVRLTVEMTPVTVVQGWCSCQRPRRAALATAGDTCCPSGGRCGYAPEHRVRRRETHAA